MIRKAVVGVSLVIAAGSSLGCKKIMDLVRGRPEAPSASEPAPSPPGAPAQVPAPVAQSSVRTPSPTRATGCPALLLNNALPAGTVHNSALERDETWTLADSPHRLPEGITLQDGATLTLEPCAVVLVGHGNGVWAQNGSGLSAVGDATHPIRFGSDNPEPQPGDWKALWLDENVRRASRLAYVTLEHGGADWDVQPACLIFAASELHAHHVTARACRSFGISLARTGSFAADAADLTVTGVVAGNASLSGSIWVDRATSVGSIPAGAYTGNASDEVYIANAAAGGEAAIRQSTVWRNLGVAYHIADNQDLRVDGPSAPVLTIAPGVSLRMGRESGISVGYDAEGGLVIDGGAEATRINLRPAGTDESPGQWRGVYFGPRFNRSASRLRFVNIRNAGSNWSSMLCDWQGPSSDSAFVMFEAAPNAGSVEHVTFAAGAPEVAAFGRKWNGTPIDFNAAALGNDFSGFGAGCHQSPVADANGTCPDPAPACN